MQLVGLYIFYVLRFTIEFMCYLSKSNDLLAGRKTYYIQMAMRLPYA